MSKKNAGTTYARTNAPAVKAPVVAKKPSQKSSKSEVKIAADELSNEDLNSKINEIADSIFQESAQMEPEPVDTIAAIPTPVNSKATKSAKTKGPRIVRLKQYMIRLGSLKASRNPTAQYAYLTRAISALHEAGKEYVTRDEIINEAHKLGMVPSKMTNQVLFAWYRPQLVVDGWVVESLEIPNIAPVETAE